MTARDTLRNLTIPLAIVVALVAVLVALLQIPRWVLALAAELAELLVIAGQAAQDHLAGRQVAVITNVPYARRFRPAGDSR